MEQTAAPLKKTPLNARHRASGAKMVPFGGWDMPVEYAASSHEHLAVRTARRPVRRQPHGRDRDRRQGRRSPPCSASRPTTRRSLQVGQAQYSGPAHAAGHVRRRPARLPPRPARTSCSSSTPATSPKDYAWIAEQHQAGRRRGRRRRELALRAARACRDPKRWTSCSRSPASSSRPSNSYWFAHGEVANVRATISRTGYTGEDGFEIFVPPQSGGPRVAGDCSSRASAADVDPVRPRRARHAAPRSRHAPARQRHRRNDDGGRSGPELDRRLEEGRLHRRRRAARAEGERRRRGRSSASRCSTRGIARHGYDAYVGDAKAGRRHQRHADAVSEEVHRHGLSAGRAHRAAAPSSTCDIRGRRTRARVVPMPFYKAGPSIAGVTMAYPAGLQVHEGPRVDRALPATAARSASPTTRSSSSATSSTSSCLKSARS